MKIETPTTNEPHFIHQAIEWTGHSGKTYRYYIWPRHAKIEGHPPGNFMHVKVAEDGTLQPVFIGQTDDLNRRLLSKEELDCVDAQAATQIHIRAHYHGEDDRMTEEHDLIARWHPVCNLALREAYLRNVAVEVAAI
jgi:hypothetical protein